MIELLWKNTCTNLANFELMKFVNEFLVWLFTEINTRIPKDDKDKLKYEGCMTLLHKDNNAACLLFTDGEGEEEVMEILKQPPGEYHGKYVAHIIFAEASAASEEESDTNEDDPT